MNGRGKGGDKVGGWGIDSIGRGGGGHGGERERGLGMNLKGRGGRGTYGILVGLQGYG